jgi:hypothetical protein
MINRLMTLLLEELRDGGIPDPLTGSFTFAAIWDDLARLAGETPPAAVRQRYEADSPLTDPSNWGDYLASNARVSPAAPSS